VECEVDWRKIPITLIDPDLANKKRTLALSPDNDSLERGGIIVGSVQAAGQGRTLDITTAMK
jgi:hypothetical protein